MKLIVAAAAAGALFLPLAAHAASPFDGTWKGASGPEITFKVSPDAVNESYSTGGALNMKTGGSFTSFQPASIQANTLNLDAISVRMRGPHMMVQVAKHGGKVVNTLTSTVSADGKRMTVVSVDARTHRTTTYHATKL